MTQLSFDEENKGTGEKQKSKSNVLSVRLSKDDVAERDSLGMNDKEYFNHKMHLQASTPVEVSHSNNSVDASIIRKGVEAEMENKYLKRQVEQLQTQSNQGLSGLGDLVKVEMEKYKHEQEFAKLKEDNKKYEARIVELEKELEDTENDNEELLKRVQMIEVVKEAGPHIAKALKGFSEKGLSGAMEQLSSSLSGTDTEPVALTEGEGMQDKINFANRFLSLFPETEKQQQIMQLLAEFSAHPWLLDKVNEFIEALKNQTQTA